MATENKSNKIITIVLALIITLAGVTILYVSLPQGEEKSDGTQTPVQATILTVVYGDEQVNYTIGQLENLTSFSGSGGYIKLGMLPNVVIEGPFNFIGVKITTLLSHDFNLPYNYSITVKATDNKTKEYYYNLSQINGIADVYNESGVPNYTGGMTTILAYKKDGDYITDTDKGPLWMALVDEGKITSSRLWTKMVYYIEIKELT